MGIIIRYLNYQGRTIIDTVMKLKTLLMCLHVERAENTSERRWREFKSVALLCQLYYS